MKLLDRLLRRKPTARVNVDALLTRYGSYAAIQLGTALALNASRCASELDTSIATADKGELHQRRFLTVCEFFYCFLHLTNRRFYSGHGETVGECWQEMLAPLVVEDFLDHLLGSFFTQPAPREYRDRMLAEMHQKINNAETEYASCRELLSETPFGNGIFNTLGRNIAALTGHGANPVTIIKATMAACDAFKEMKLDVLVDQVAATLPSRSAA